MLHKWDFLTPLPLLSVKIIFSWLPGRQRTLKEDWPRKIWSICWCWMDTGVVDDSKRLWEKNKISREGTIWRGIQCSGKIKWSAVQSFSQILLRDPLGYCFFCYGVNFIMMLLDWRECWRKWGQGNDYAKLWIDCIWLMLETWILILRRRPYLIIVRHWAYDFVTTDGQPQKYWQNPWDRLISITWPAMSPAPTQVGIKVSQSVSLLDFRQVSARLTPSAIAQWRWLMGYFS